MHFQSSVKKIVKLSLDHYIDQIPQCNEILLYHYIEVFVQCNGVNFSQYHISLVCCSLKRKLSTQFLLSKNYSFLSLMTFAFDRRYVFVTFWVVFVLPEECIHSILQMPQFSFSCLASDEPRCIRISSDNAQSNPNRCTLLMYVNFTYILYTFKFKQHFKVFSEDALLFAKG